MYYEKQNMDPSQAEGGTGYRWKKVHQKGLVPISCGTLVGYLSNHLGQKKQEMRKTGSAVKRTMLI